MAECIGQVFPGFAQNPRAVDERDAEAEIRREVPEQVAEVVRRVLERLRDLAHAGEREGVTRLDQHPAGPGELHRPLDVEQGEPEPGREPDGAAVDVGRAGQRESGEAAVAHPAQHRILLPGRARRGGREDREAAAALRREVGLLRLHRHRVPLGVGGPGDEAHSAVLALREQCGEGKRGAHAASSPSRP
ncbi:hypothetical protein JQN58_28370 [Aneurinibacillus sp. BA2021]|nr:hypothetical protein [Aneurinibacillus sp. BA2021]